MARVRIDQQINEMGKVDIFTLDNEQGAKLVADRSFLFAQYNAIRPRLHEIEHRVRELNTRRQQLQEQRNRRALVVDFKSSVIAQLEAKRQRLLDELAKVDAELERQRE